MKTKAKDKPQKNITQITQIPHPVVEACWTGDPPTVLISQTDRALSKGDGLKNSCHLNLPTRWRE